MNAELTNLENAAQEDAYLFPCSVVQRTCWFLDRLSPGTAAMNIAVRFQLEGRIDTAKLEQAFLEIVRRHEVLRTRFVVQDGEPAAFVQPEASFHLSVVDLTDLPAGSIAAESDRIATAEAHVGFDITTGPLLRATLLKTGSTSAMLLMTMHHIISDGWSIGVVTNELGALYEALVYDQTPALPPLEIQYGDYACWQRDWIASGQLSAELDHLKAKLDGFQPIYIPTDKERPSTPAGLGDIRSVLLPRALTDSLKQLSDRNGCTLFVTMFSAFAALMSLETSQSDVTIRTQTSGRDRVELETLIGWFVNSIVLRTDLSGNPTFAEYVTRNRDVVLDSLSHQSVPFEMLMNAIEPKYSSTRQLPFQVNFIFQRDFVRPWDRGGMRFIPIPSKAAGTFVDLNFFLVEREDGWRLSVDVNKDVFLPETGMRFLDNFRSILETVVQNPSIRVSEIALKQKRSAGSSATTAINDVSFNNFVPPRNECEEEIISIWKSVLKAKVVGAYSNFFDLGGHSLLAVNMLEQLRKRYGHDIKIPELFLDPTPAAMAQIITGKADYSDARDLIPIQGEGTRAPFYMIGGDHWFRPLANYVGKQRPFVGVPLLKYRHLDLSAARSSVAEELAKLLMHQQQDAPFLLGGWCADGLTAFEVGRAIERQGGAVALVVLFDAMNPDYYRDARGLMHSAGRTLHSLRAIMQGNAEQGILTATKNLVGAIGIAIGRASKRLASFQRPSAADTTVSFPLAVVRPFVGMLEEPDLGWKHSSRKPIRVVEVSGDHSSIFKEPNVKELGEKLREQLDLASH